MSSKLRTEVFPANGVIVLGDLHNFIMLVQTAASVTVRFMRDGTQFEAENVDAGYVKGLVRPWSRATIEGTPASTVRFLVGFEEIAEDFTDYRRTVGIFQQQLSATLQAPAVDVAVGAAAADMIAANTSRRKVTFKLLTTADTNIRVGPLATITIARGLQLEPGQSYTYEGTGAVAAIREGGTTAPVSVLEELY